MSSGYSEEDIRRAAEIREWLIKEISDRQEEVERLRTTLSIIDNLLKQGSFKAAANLGFAPAATTPAPAGAATTTSSSTTAQIQQQTHQTAASPQQQSTAAKKQQQKTEAAAPTLRATADSGSSISSGEDSRNIKPLKRAKDDFLLANAEISPDAVIIVPAPGIDLNTNTPPFKSFFLNRILEGMKNKDAEKVNQGTLRESDALNYKVEEDDSSGSGSGIIKRIVINKYREKDRLQEIFNTSAWVFTRMLEKSGR
jgi:hypothetical protein